MRHFIAPWRSDSRLTIPATVGRDDLRRRAESQVESSIAPGNRQSAPDIDTGAADHSRGAARALAEALDRAMKLGLWEHADRIAASAERIAPDHPMLCERLARLRVEQHDPEQALAVIDSCPVHTSSLRLWRAICLLQLSRREEAHLDLRQWAGKASARVLDHALNDAAQYRSTIVRDEMERHRAVCRQALGEGKVAALAPVQLLAPQDFADKPVAQGRPLRRAA